MISFRVGRRATAMAAMSMALVVAVAACGSGDGDDEAPDPRANLTKPEIKIGMMVALTGPTSSSDAPAEPVAKAWADWVNANGGIDGHPVSMVIEDTKSDGATATAAAKKLLADTSVLAVTLTSSATETQTAEVLGEEDIAVVGATGYTPQVWGAVPNFFGTTPFAIPDILAQFASAKAVGATNWSAVICTENAQCKSSVPLYEAGAGLYGQTLGGHFEVSVSAPSYTAECLRLLEEDTDYLQLSIAPAAGSRLIADCDAQGYTGWYGASAGSVSTMLTEIDGVRLAGGIQGFPWWADVEPVAEYRDAMEEYQPDAEYANPSATAVWSSLEVIRASLAEVSETPTREDVFTGLYGMKDFDAGGLLPQSVTFTEGETPAVLDCIWLYKLEDGEFTSAPLDGPSGNSVTSGDLKTDCLKLPSS